jgi:uncharacterized membrane protein
MTVSYGQTILNNVTRGYSIDSLFVALLTNGDASVDYNLVIGPNNDDTNLILFGPTVQNLTLTDYNGTEIPFSGSGTNYKVKLNSRELTNVHVTYITPDLVDKQDRNWIFSLPFNDKFLLKMPGEARIIEMIPQPYLTPSNEQSLWGVGPGQVLVKYVIGPLGTREEAQANVRLLEESIKDTKVKYDDIKLNETYIFLNKTKNSFTEGNFIETVNYATKASILLQNTTENYVLGKNTITQVDSGLQKRKDEGYNVAREENLLKQANSLFSNGQYQEAMNMAKSAIDEKNFERSNSTPSIEIVLLASIIIGISISIFFIFKNKLRGDRNAMDDIKQDGTSVEKMNSLTSENSSQIDLNPNNKMNSDKLVPPMTGPTDENDIKTYLNEVVKEVNNVRNGAIKYNENTAYESQPMDMSTTQVNLREVVAQMKINKPYLRMEDKQLLDFLAEKEGTAFESEIRQKFVLPRTSLWRMVKRLEREELLEIRKIGGQNMIKLKAVEK